MYRFCFSLSTYPFACFSLVHAFLRAVHRLSNERCIAKRCGGAGGTERYIAKRWGAVQRLKYVPFPQFSGRRARVACPSLPEDLRRDFSFSFPFSFHLKNVVFGRSLVQLILAALSLYLSELRKAPERACLAMHHSVSSA